MFAIVILAAPLCAPVTVSASDDPDQDGVEQTFDNCTTIANADQLDSDCDGYGNRCDADLNNSGGTVNFADLAAFRAAFGSSAAPGAPGAKADLNASGGTVNFADLAVFRALFGTPVGPSGLPQPFRCSPPTPVAVSLLSSAPQLSSRVNGGLTVALHAIVRGADRTPLVNVPATFSTDHGYVFTQQLTTNYDGRVMAHLAGGPDAINRPITVTATAGSVSGQTIVDVIGTRLVLRGPASPTMAVPTTFALELRDRLGNGVGATAVTLASAAGNVIAPNPVVTDASGNAVVTFTGLALGVDTLTASMPGYATTASVAVIDGDFRIDTPASPIEVPINTPQSVQAVWTRAGVPQVGETISLNTTRGSLAASSALTDSSGRAASSISSANPGVATITAVNDEGNVARATLEFVATQAATVDVLAVPPLVTTSGTSFITAIVRDSTGAPVKNRAVEFMLTDPTGGYFFVGSGVTDRYGRAVDTYRAGWMPSDVNAVQVVARLPGTAPQISDSIALTVRNANRRIDAGTTGPLFTPTGSLYAKEWTFIVVDAGLDPVANTALQAQIRSSFYHKGSLAPMPGPTPGDVDWTPAYTESDGVARVGISCRDEDENRDGFLSAAEDDPLGGNGLGNGNGALDAGMRAVIVGIPSNAPADACNTQFAFAGASAGLTTDAYGHARACVLYPRSDNGWVEVELSALTGQFGYEYSMRTNFTLEGSREDWDDDGAPPEGQVSPFGTASSCRQPD